MKVDCYQVKVDLLWLQLRKPIVYGENLSRTISLDTYLPGGVIKTNLTLYKTI